MKGEGKGETDESVEVYGFRDWVDDGRSVKQDGTCGESSPGRKDSTFSLGRIASTVFLALRRYPGFVDTMSILLMDQDKERKAT